MSVVADARELQAVNKPGGFLSQLGEAGACKQAVGGVFLCSTVMKVCGEEAMVVGMSVVGRVVGSTKLGPEGRLGGVYPGLSNKRNGFGTGVG